MTRNPTLPLLPNLAPIRVSLLNRDAVARRDLMLELADLTSLQIVDGDTADVGVWDTGSDDAAPRQLPDLRAALVPVVVLIAEPGQAAAALAAGARGVMLRSQAGEGLTSALAAARSGLTVIDTSLAQTLVPASALRVTPETVRRGGRAVTELTEREMQVVQLLAEGLSNKLVADRLGISDHTAKFHVNGVMAKLSASTRTEAVVEAVRRGLVTL